MWNRWQKGDSLHTIGRLFERSHTSVRRILAETGGIRPSPRSRSRLALSLAEREEISRGIVAGHSIRSIAQTLGRAPSTVSRELQRNGGRQLYRANQADQAAWDRAHRPKRCKLVANTERSNERLRFLAETTEQVEQVPRWVGSCHHTRNSTFFR
jgi:IS30 family transposase